MPFGSKKEGTGRRRYARRSTKSRLSVRPPRNPRRMIAAFVTVILAAMLTVAAALICGSMLDRRSRAYREQEAARDWMLDERVATPLTVSVPDVRAAAILPEQNTAPFLTDYEGILLPLRSSEGGLYFRSAVAAEAGIVLLPPPLADEPNSGVGLSLPDEVHRIARRGLRVIATFTVTYPDAPDGATRAYRRGLELALLTDYAAAGMDDLLILGLPCGDDTADREAADFIESLRALLASLPKPPAIGMALPLSAFTLDAEDGADGASESDGERAPNEGANSPASLYAGRQTPARMGKVCDFIALDLRQETAASAEALLPRLMYAYVRYSLRLLLPEGDASEVPIRHGFRRVFEMPPAPEQAP